jgi:MoaA/NifB/PqqE/SkfB family radical SAM enzyme
MSGSPYSPLKIFHHQDRLKKLRAGVHPVLLHVQLIPTNRCNQDCNFCAYRMHGYSSSEDFIEKDQIPFPILEEVIGDCVRLDVRAIEITGGGEPTIYPQFVEMCNLIAEREIDYAVVSNGVNLNEKKLNAMLGAKWVRFSIDSGEPETYARIRHSVPDQLFRTRYNVRALVDLRNKTGNDLLIGVGFVVTEDNWKEIFQAAQNAKEDGVDNFRISAVFQNEGASYFSGFYEEAKDLCSAVQQQLQSDDFKVFNMFGERLSDLEQQFPDYSFCGYQYFTTYIGADLNVYRCCNTAYNPRGFLGSLETQSFYDLWNSVKDKLDDFDARRCPRCMFNVKNRQIAYALEENPRHVNFL